jgi:hypothetical protein
MEAKMFDLGDQFRKENNMTDELCLKLSEIKLSNTKTLNYSGKKDREILEKGVDKGQAENLNQAKRENKNK